MKMPAYTGFDSYASSRRTAESIYYSAKEFDSADDSDCMRLPPPHFARRPSLLDPMGPSDAIFSRRYVDPWDMENYVYIRKQVLDPSLESEVAPSPAGVPIQSKFYYVPGDLESCRECSAEIVMPIKADIMGGDDLVDVDDEEEEEENDEEDRADDDIEDDDLEADELDEDDDGFYTERYDTVMEEDSIGGDDRVYSSYTDLETSSTEQPSSCDSPMSALRLHTPGFGKSASNRRPIVLPKPLPQLEFPGPPSYDYYEPSCCYMPLPPPIPSHHMPLLEASTVPPSISGGGNYYTLNDCFECARQEVEHVPLYAPSRQSPMRRRSRSMSVVSMSMARRPSQVSMAPTLVVAPPVPVDSSTAVSIAATNANVCYTPQHFSLSKKGLLQIDYSCNWDNLDRYIAK
ncbi:nucleoprotein TPR-like [Topomyia yanbarensis]|uniref:nucleoprotein TPR-like n=1 Tax=Topomyia yanbarensis TaxID=2498891 RepID=UPI00273B01BB|nr:nucleoprotein TPR-like [Topomyia yanbarensis]XP_058829396.1 nucleoprotein TPR-like [Topomyia yanbarensis]XP_058829397.1 nucleoprotein TPR-like [Topomyia yanbarensis]XP_058829399.1 nucleoprotein TPR-like [Topomyia yanbarensis]